MYWWGDCRERRGAVRGVRSDPRQHPLYAALYYRRDIFAAQQCFCLRQAVRQELGLVIADRIFAVQRDDEIGRNDACSLVHELVERVLAVGARFAPNNGRRGVIDDVPVAIDALAVTLHFKLLQIGWEPRQCLAVWHYPVAFGALEIALPNAEQGEGDRQILC